MSYCQYCRNLPSDNPHRRYHDEVYGRKISDDNELFGRLILEMNQAGLSWDIILKREAHFRVAYDGYQIDAVARYNQADIDRLMQNPGVIRNRLKIEAAIYNAKQILALKEGHGSFIDWIEGQQIKNKEEWVKVFKKNFKFVGQEIVNEFLLSIGEMEGSHESDCPIFQQLNK
ncbi:MAG: DNA-3-methyladenine glycosylase I [Crocinitomicaceae bacterium]|nr:DNA-3-methyladenine glycosylase I [Crocinitomicaceae bacterium]